MELSGFQPVLEIVLMHIRRSFSSKTLELLVLLSACIICVMLTMSYLCCIMDVSARNPACLWWFPFIPIATSIALYINMRFFCNSIYATIIVTIDIGLAS